MSDVKEIIGAAGSLVDILIVLAVAAALLVLFWGLALFVFEAGNEKNYEKGRNLIMWGLIALFVMVSVWGIVQFFQYELGIRKLHVDAPPNYPEPPPIGNPNDRNI